MADWQFDNITGLPPTTLGNNSAPGTNQMIQVYRFHIKQSFTHLFCTYMALPKCESMPYSQYKINNA